MEESTIRVLVAEDYEPWCRFVLSTLHQFSGLHVICEVADGSEAVQKAEDRSLEAVEEAFRMGASGFVVKSDAGSELLSAIKAILEGKWFTSSSLAHYAIGKEGKQTDGDCTGNNIIELPRPQHAETNSRHDVTFYSDDQRFLNGLAQYIAGALRSGSSAVIAATESHRKGLLSRLSDHNLDIGAAIEQRRYIAVDAAHTLSTLMVNSMPDRGLFMKTFGNLVHLAAKASKSLDSHVSVFAGCMNLICAEGNAEAAIRMEEFGSELIRTHDADVLCGYFSGNAHLELHSHTYQRICAEHSSVHSW